MRRQRLGVALRRLRDSRGLSAEAAGRRLGWSASKISRLETASIGVRITDVGRLLDLYDADEAQRGDLLRLAEEALQKGWWDDYPEIQQTALSAYIALEDDAKSVLQLESDVIPGLLQTEQYARCLIQSTRDIIPLTPTTIPRRIEVRLRRQRLLTPPRNLPLTVVLDEAVLLRRIGDRETMANQLRRLVEVAALPHVDLRVLPLNGAHGAGLGSFMLLDFDAVYGIPLPSVLHVENITAVHLQDEALTETYRRLHKWIMAQSLTPQRTLELISDIVAQRWRNIAP